MADFKEARAFVESAPGKYFDPDRMYRYQCKDLVDAYCDHLWGIDASKYTIRPGNANECWHGYNPQYFDRIDNVVGDLNSYPQPGDVGIAMGDKYNEHGHIWVVVKADGYSMLALQQNGDGTANGPAELAVLSYDQPGMGPVIGWLRPKLTGSWEPAPIAAAPALPAATTLNVIDVSNWQTGINVAATGAQAVFVKASEGVGWADPAYRSHVDRVRKAGLPLGLYHFARPNASDGNTADAEAQSFIAAVLPVLKPGDVVALDWESDDTADAAWAARWLDLVGSALGRRPLLYSYLNLIKSGRLDSLKGWPLWLAVYPNMERQSFGPTSGKPDLPGWNILMWQYSSAGRLTGYAGDLDLNVFYGGVDVWAQLGGAGTQPVSVPAPTPLPSLNLIRVEAGDTMSGIAVQFGVSLESLLAANPGFNPDVIYPGQTLHLPAAAQKPAPAPVPVAAGRKQVVVEPGDTMYLIAQQFGVDLNAFIAANPGLNPDVIFPGEVLWLPGEPVAAVTQVIVEPGDTLYGIGLQWGVPLQRLVAANPGIDPNLIYPGQVLQLA
jgi:lysozyme